MDSKHIADASAQEEPNATLALDGHDLSANDLTPGQKATGSVWFDAAKGAQTGGKIALKDVLADGDAGYWTL